MGFSFFCLPFEIRGMVYEAIFGSASHGKAVTPDPTYFRRRRGGSLAARTINNGSSFLRSCHQAHNEATVILYGKNVFYFDEHGYGSLTSELNVRDHCKLCFTGKHSGPHVVPRCDYVFMHDWLVSIGDQNRLKIRHLELHFFRLEFILIQKGSLAGKRHVFGNHMGGVFPKNALQLLAGGHQLETVGIFFSNDEPAKSVAFKSLFLAGYFGQSDDLRSALAGVKGIKKLICPELATSAGFRCFRDSQKDSIDDANASLREVRRLMESGYASRKEIY